MSAAKSTDTASQLNAKLMHAQVNDTILNVPDPAQADVVQPTYEPDDGLPTPEQMAAMRKAAGPHSMQSVCSSLFDKTL